MKLLSILFYLAILPVVAISQQTINATVEHDGQTRQYILYVPANYDGSAPVPLLLNFHGYTSNATQQMFYGDFRPISDTAGFIIAHPEGTVDLVGNTHFNVGWGSSSIDDVGFVSAMIDKISSDYTIDQTRVYSTGMSNGGFISYELACQLSDRIAAVASVTGSMSPFTYTNCDPQHSMPVLEIHGTADGTVSYTGSTIGRAIDDVMAYWVDYNQCETSPVSTDLPDIDTQDGSTVTRYVWDQGANGVSVELLKIDNGGHRWPGAAFNLPGTNHDIDASLEVWSFFSKFDINGLIDQTSNISSDSDHDENIFMYPNPILEQVWIERPTEHVTDFNILSSTGVVIEKGQLVSKKTKLDLTHLPKGLFFISIDGQLYKLIKF